MALTTDELLQALQSGSLFHQFFLPFIFTFAIFWGMLSIIKVFSRKINLILALIFTIAAGYGGIFTLLSNYLMTLGASIVIIAFAAIFIVGVAAWVFLSGGGLYNEAVPERAIEKINEKLKKLEQKYRREGDPAKRRTLDDEMFRLERQKEHIHNRKRY